MYGKVNNIIYFDKKLAGRLLGLPPVAMTTTVVYHTFAMPFSMQRGRPLKFVIYHRVVLGVKKQHVTKMAIFANARWRTAAVLRIALSPYLSRELPWFDEVWYTDANSHSEHGNLTKMEISKIQDGGRPPFKK